jgi:hypothetical protein
VVAPIIVVVAKPLGIACTITSLSAGMGRYLPPTRLPGEPLEGVADRHFHHVELLTLRLTLGKAF